MKKVLFATTALIASAGIASAQGVALSGSAEMGIIGGSAIETQFSQNADVSFTLSGATDNGLAFGASVDLDEAEGINDPETQNGGVAVFISGDFGTLTLGDTDGALDRVMQDASAAGNPGSINDAETGHDGYNGSFGESAFDGQILRYEYSFGDFLVAVSHEQGATGADGLLLATDTDGASAIGVRYSGSFGAADVTAGLGYSSTSFAGGDQTIVGVSVLAELSSGFSAAIGYSDWSDVGGVAGADDSHAYIGVGYAFDAFSVHANYGEFDSGASGYGIAASYDLGGGASLHGAYGSSDGGDDSWSFGVAMSF